MIAVAELTPRQRAAKRQWSDPRARALLLARQIVSAERRRVDRLVNEHLHLVKLAGSHAAHLTGLPREDFEQAAFLGLRRAMESFDPTRGAAPGTWAYWWMKAECQAEYLAMRSTIRVPKRPKAPIPWTSSLDVDDDEGGTLGSNIPDDDAPDLAAGLHRAELNDALAAALAGLPERDALVVEMRFGINGAKEPHSYVEIAERFGMSTEWCRKVVERALVHLRELLAEFAV